MVAFDKKVYNKEYIKRHFDTCSCISVSRVAVVLKKIMNKVMGFTKDNLERMEKEEI